MTAEPSVHAIRGLRLIPGVASRITPMPTSLANPRLPISFTEPENVMLKMSHLSKVYRTFSKLEQEYEREPSVEELAEAMERTVDSVADVMSKSGRAISLDAPFGDESENSLLDVMASGERTTDHKLLEESLSVTLRNALSNLPDRERAILMLYYGVGTPQAYSLEEIGSRYRLTRERVRQLKDKAIVHLRRNNRNKELFKFLGD